MKKHILSILLITVMVSAINVDAISVFGKDLHFGKLFNKAKPAAPISAVVDSKVNFDVTSPKKGVTLETGNITNITWKTNDKIDVYNLTLEGGQKYDLGKAYNAGKVFSWMISKDIKPGNYKLVFTDKFGNKYKSDEFKVKTAIEIQSYKIESSVGTPVTDKSYFNVDYKVTSFVSPVGEFNLKINCPAGVSAVLGQDRNDKCNKTVAGNSFSKSVSKPNEYNLTLSFTNKNKTAQLVTAELFANGKSYGKGINMIEPTKEVVVSPIINFTYPTAGSNMYIGKTNEITWTTNVSDPNVYSVYLVGGSLGGSGSILLGTTIPNQKSFAFTFPDTVKLGSDYQISFSGKGATGGLSPKFNILSKPASTFKFTYPTANQTFLLGRNYDITWTGKDEGIDNYSVYLIGGSFGTDKNSGIGLIPKAIASQGYYTFRVLTLLSPLEKYQLLFSAPGVSDKKTELFSVKEANNTPILTKVSTTVTAIKNNNIDVGVNASFRLNIQSQGTDIPVNSVKATIALKNVATGDVITTAVVNGVTESGLMYFTDGSTKMLDFTAIFASSSLPVGVTNVQAVLQSVSYTTMNDNVNKSITTGLEVFNTNFVTIDIPTPKVLTFTKDLSDGMYDIEVKNLRRFLINKGFLPPMMYQDPSMWFDKGLRDALALFQTSINISPANGYFGAMTRAYANDHFNDPAVDITKCPQSLTLYNVTYTITPCSISTSMIDGAGDKAFTVYITPSVPNNTYSYYTYGYGVGLPTYGILGGGSGGAFATTTLNLNFADSVLSKGVYKGYLPIHIGNGNNDNNFLYFNFNLEVK